MDKNFKLSFLLILLLISACASSSAPAAGGKAEARAKAKAEVEDLSAYRPKYAAPEADAAPAPVLAAVMPANHVNRQVQVLMDTVASANKAVKYAQGYRILAYTGNDRATVMQIRKAIIDRVPDEKDYLTYQQPTFRLKIGDYYNRLEAQQVLLQLRDIIPNALVVSDQINVIK